MPDEIIPADSGNVAKSPEDYVPDGSRSDTRPTYPPPPLESRLPPVIPTPIPTKPNELTDRITIQFQAHHEQYGENPTTFPVSTSYMTQGTEEAYQRKRVILKPGPKQNLLESLCRDCLLENPALVMIANRTGQQRLLVQRTPEEKAQVDQSVLLVSLCEDCPDEAAMMVRPGLFLFVEVQPHTSLWLKSASGELRLSVTIFPR